MLKHVIKMQERAAAQNGIGQKADGKSGACSSSSQAGGELLTAAPIGDSLFGSLPVTKVAAAPDSKDKFAAATRAKPSSTAQIGIKWNELLAVCTTSMITKNDIEMRKLIGK